MIKKDLLLDDFKNQSLSIDDAGAITGGASTGTILYGDGTDCYATSEETAVTDDCGSDSTKTCWDGDCPASGNCDDD